METEHDIVTIIQKHNESKDLLQWRGRVYEYLMREEFELLWFQDLTKGEMKTQNRKWMKEM